MSAQAPSAIRNPTKRGVRDENHQQAEPVLHLDHEDACGQVHERRVANEEQVLRSIGEYLCRQAHPFELPRAIKPTDEESRSRQRATELERRSEPMLLSTPK